MASGTGDIRSERGGQGLCISAKGTWIETSSGSPKMVTSSSDRIRPALVACAALCAALLVFPRAANAAGQSGGHGGGGGSHSGVSHSGGGHVSSSHSSGRTTAAFHGGSRGGFHGGFHGRGFRHFRGGFSPWWGWGWGWGGWPYDWWWGGPSVYVVTGDEDGYVDVAARTGRYAIVKTDVSPEEAQLYLDGKYIGSADDFDGMPGYLYLGPGKYHLEFRLPNYTTFATDLDVTPGQRVRLDQKLKLAPGKSALDQFPPESKGTPLGRVFAKGADGAAEAAPPPGPQGPRYGTRRDDGWSDRDTPPQGEGMSEEQMDARPEPLPRRAANRARMRFKVTPEDAAVYVDDKYLGAGEDLEANPRGVVTDPGKHTITVTRPGYKTKTVDITVRIGAPVDVVVELEK